MKLDGREEFPNAGVQPPNEHINKPVELFGAVLLVTTPDHKH